MRCRKAIGTLDAIPKSQGTGTILRQKTHEKAATSCCRVLKGEMKMFSINGTKNAWIFGRDVFGLEYAKAEEQIKALTSEAESEGYKVIGTTIIRETINSKKDQAEMQKLMAAAQVKKIDAVFVFSSKHISEDYDVSGAFMDALNKCDVVVYDNEGYEYSYDWYFHNVCRSNRFAEKRGNGDVQ